MKFLLLSVLVLYVTGQSTPGVPSVLLETFKELFQLLDADSSGDLNETEMAAYCKSVDANADGKVSKEEFQANRQDPQAQALQLPTAFLNATFTFYDTLGNKFPPDGFIACDEVSVFFDAMDSNQRLTIHHLPIPVWEIHRLPIPVWEIVNHHVSLEEYETFLEKVAVILIGIATGKIEIVGK